MSTRVGNIDSGAITHIMKSRGFSPDELNSYLNKECGLLGISGKTDDMRELIKLEESSDVLAKKAIDVFCYRIKKEIGGMIGVLGGIDALVFTATMGERSNIIRERVCRGFEGIGMFLDKEKNDGTTNGDGVISVENSPVKVLVVKTDEMREVCEEIMSLAE
jgi:acetate kinase